ncbi:hypothetical protein B296_00021629 [Ensete ventricosum]|uniref:SKP1-like protein n=1 Tax=Ensete ventricosum TaxID=4639 RepID=A0A427A2T2_ENSVE|nr:hypothetical protein B296_00021629 [Ensete ventricosum]
MAKTIKLRSSDGEVFEVEEAVAMELETIKHVIEDGCADGGITLYNVTSEILVKVIEYCKKHVDAAGSFSYALGIVDKDLESWDAEFVNVDLATLVDISNAANYLNIEGLLDLTTQAIADNIKGKMPEEIREIFNIENDFTPEDEQRVREENHWAFE